MKYYTEDHLWVEINGDEVPIKFSHCKLVERCANTMVVTAIMKL